MPAKPPSEFWDRITERIIEAADKQVAPVRTELRELKTTQAETEVRLLSTRDDLRRTTQASLDALNSRIAPLEVLVIGLSKQLAQTNIHLSYVGAREVCDKAPAIMQEIATKFEVAIIEATNSPDPMGVAVSYHNYILGVVERQGLGIIIRPGIPKAKEPPHVALPSNRQ